MKIVIGSDHGAVELKAKIIEHLKGKGHNVVNVGVDTTESVDYPDIAKIACTEFKTGGYDFGILCCGTGIGISIAANKVKGIRCSLLCDLFSAEMTKAHNNPDFIAFGGRIQYKDKVEDMIDKFMETKFEGGRHQTRINKTLDIELDGMRGCC